MSNEVVVHVLLNDPKRPVSANRDGIRKLLAEKAPVEMTPEAPETFVEIPEKDNRRKAPG